MTINEIRTPPRVAILLQALGLGGAERTMLTLADGLAKQGCLVDLLLVVKRGALLGEVPTTVRLIELGTVSRWTLLAWLVRLPWQTFRALLPALFRNQQPKVMRSLPRLMDYLRDTRPDGLLTTLPNNNLVALWAKWLCRSSTRIVVCEGNTLSKDLPPPSRLFEGKWPYFMRQWYPRADAVVAVSDGVADDLSKVVGLARDRIITIFNPVDLDRLRQLAAAPLDHPWFVEGEPPVILAVGRLVPQKDFSTLLRAFARVRQQRAARLVILGDGAERRRLEDLADSLGVANNLQMPGEVLNPFAYMARARLFVLSSAYEGLPTVLIEALACGCPIVSTACPSGPKEILQGGALGPLVPVGDAEALTAAIIQTLEKPTDRHILRERAEDFTADISAGSYLQILDGTTANSCFRGRN